MGSPTRPSVSFHPATPVDCVVIPGSYLGIVRELVSEFMAVQMVRDNLPSLRDLQMLAWADVDVEELADLAYATPQLYIASGPKKFTVFILAVIEPKVFQHYIQTVRILPRDVDQPTVGESLVEDPGTRGPNGGKPWRPSHHWKGRCFW